MPAAATAAFSRSTLRRMQRTAGAN